MLLLRLKGQVSFARSSILAESYQVHAIGTTALCYPDGPPEFDSVSMSDSAKLVFCAMYHKINSPTLSDS
jgi:hypothetical protein